MLFSSTTGHRPVILVLAAVLGIILIANVVVLWSSYGWTVLFTEWLPSVRGFDHQWVGNQEWDKIELALPWNLKTDGHPIQGYMAKADAEFERYKSSRSRTFKEAVSRYRARYGRHPPPGYKEWYKLARKKQVYNIDDFDQINADLRPFWAVEPSLIRNQAAHCVDDISEGMTIIAIRNGRAYIPLEGWRPEAFVKFVSRISSRLPDMDIAMNIMDQPRVVVPWNDLQQMLKTEEQSRSLSNDAADSFTPHMNNYWTPTDTVPDRIWIKALGLTWFWDSWIAPVIGSVEAVKYDWVHATAKPYMDLALKACPPDSFAGNVTADGLEITEATYKDPMTGLITNYNLSSDLCTVGPQLSQLHGLLYASTSMLASQTLYPVFSECKVSVNNDILFPANMYFTKDKRYTYNDRDDISWDIKNDIAPWRGVTSGGTTHAEEGDRWKQMHRARLVLLTNATELENDTETVLAAHDGGFLTRPFLPQDFAAEHTDIGFTEKVACLPNCDFLDDSLTMLDSMDFTETFRSKYLIDVDGMSFSGRWRAFLQSRSLGIKATIFREWHDSRLFAWKHFVPMDNRYDDLYLLLTYFIGAEQHQISASGRKRTIEVPRHDFEAYTIAHAGREWAAKVLREEDMEIYLYRLLLEYGRIIDDNRLNIGYVGDGGQEMVDFDLKHPPVD